MALKLFVRLNRGSTGNSLRQHRNYSLGSHLLQRRGLAVASFAMLLAHGFEFFALLRGQNGQGLLAGAFSQGLQFGLFGVGRQRRIGFDRFGLLPGALHDGFDLRFLVIGQAQSIRHLFHAFAAMSLSRPSLREGGNGGKGKSAEGDSGQSGNNGFFIIFSCECGDVMPAAETDAGDAGNVQNSFSTRPPREPKICGWRNSREGDLGAAAGAGCNGQRLAQGRDQQGVMRGSGAADARFLQCRRPATG